MPNDDFDPAFPPLAQAQITIVGLGLMGGSLAMRLKADATCRRVVGLSHREATVTAATRQGVVDWATTDPAAALAHADIVVLSTPVRILLRQLQDFAPLFKPGAIVTDVGSTKGDITAALAALPAHVRPIGSHPMCGKEASGLSAADPTLYENATWVVSPLRRTPPQAVAVTEALARAVGAVPLRLEPGRHDSLVAAISHVPYLLSVALVLAAQSVAEEDETVWNVAASGFKDTSRLAASDVTMMMDILLTNREAALATMGRLEAQLHALADALSAGDEEVFRAMLNRAREQRLALYPPDSPAPPPAPHR